MKGFPLDDYKHGYSYDSISPIMKHWECICGILNALDREKCLGCGKERDLKRSIKSKKAYLDNSNT